VGQIKIGNDTASGALLRYVQYRVSPLQSVSYPQHPVCHNWHLIGHPVGGHWATTTDYDIQHIFCISNSNCFTSGYPLSSAWNPSIVNYQCPSKTV